MHDFRGSVWSTVRNCRFLKLHRSIFGKQKALKHDDRRGLGESGLYHRPCRAQRDFQSSRPSGPKGACKHTGARCPGPGTYSCPLAPALSHCSTCSRYHASTRTCAVQVQLCDLVSKWSRAGLKIVSHQNNLRFDTKNYRRLQISTYAEDWPLLISIHYGPVYESGRTLGTR